MIIIKIVRYIMGYVKFRAVGVFTERFLNLLISSGSPVWNITKSGYEMVGYIKAGEYKTIRKHAKKTGVSLRVIKKHGLPFSIKRVKKRKGILVGLVIFITVMVAVSSFVWEIEVEGNESISEQLIHSVVEELGIKPGILKSDVDPDSLEREIIMKIPELSWVGVSMAGSKIVISVKERVMPPQMIPLDSPCNVISKTSGTIVYMEAYDGMSVVKPGDSVFEGQLLISGIVEDTQGNTYLKHAHGSVIAQTNREIVIEVDKVQPDKNYTGEVITKRKLSIFGLEIPLYFSEVSDVSADLSVESSNLEIFGITFPISVNSTKYTLYEPTEKVLSEEQARQEAERRLYTESLNLLQGVEVIDSSETFVETENSYILTVSYLCKEDIAIKKEILTP